jgi:predicted ATPase
MKIKSLNIKNFKSIVDITINEPNPFTVFVGPNGSGKSNIFEALEAIFLPSDISFDLLGGVKKIRNRNNSSQNISLFISFEPIDNQRLDISVKNEDSNQIKKWWINAIPPFKNDENRESYKERLIERASNFSRIFIENSKLNKLKLDTDRLLSLDCSNLEKVLKRLLEEEFKREEITDWLSLFIPEFDKIEVQKRPHSSKEDLLIYQKHFDEPFDRELISDGTYNIIALLTAVYQSEEPQFLCIEEPENGLHPFVIRKLVDFFRHACEDKGHYIWLNTHSQTLVECLTANEVIVVDKVEGETRTNQLKGTNLHGLDMAEYWLSGATGGGTPW